MIDSSRKNAVLVTGGAGYIGSHFVALLAEQGVRYVVLDNLSKGHRSFVPANCLVVGSVGDRQLVAEVCREWNVDVAVHFAAFAYVEESVADPALYYRNNILAGIDFLDGLRDASVNSVVFSSSCATYGIPPIVGRIAENLEQKPINPYGYSKLVFEQMLKDYEAAYGLRSFSLRYFNAAGASYKYELFEGHDPETHIIPRAIAAAYEGLTLRINGSDYPTRDGTCERDYVHVDDLATAHLAAVARLRGGSEADQINLGLGRGSTLLELISAIEKVTQKKLSVEFGPRRPGDPPSLIADAKRASAVLGWEPRYQTIDEIIETAVLSFQRYRGYKLSR